MAEDEKPPNGNKNSDNNNTTNGSSSSSSSASSSSPSSQRSKRSGAEPKSQPTDTTSSASPDNPPSDKSTLVTNPNPNTNTNNVKEEDDLPMRLSWSTPAMNSITRPKSGWNTVIPVAPAALINGVRSIANNVNVAKGSGTTPSDKANGNVVVAKDGDSSNGNAGAGAIIKNANSQDGNNTVPPPPSSIRISSSTLPPLPQQTVPGTTIPSTPIQNPQHQPSHQPQPQQQQQQPTITQPSKTTTRPTKPPVVPPPRPQNVVLPSYEAELLADNSVLREPKPKAWYHQMLHSLNKAVIVPISGGGSNANSSGVGKEKSLQGGTGMAGGGRIEKALGRLMRTPYDVKKVAVIGVHGWFPGKLVKAVVGEPVGTSGRFAEKMGQATREFFAKRYGINLPPEAITTIPLEGEGKVEERVDLLYRQLTRPDVDWLSKLKEADLILVSAHSQGTPVSIMLFARLIREGLVDLERQRACVLAMAGISHGPFPLMKSSVVVQYLEADPARQLFEFNDWNSPISIKYRTAMSQVLASGTRVVAVGSWYDQVVPLYSAIMHAFNHPNIYRAIYIDGADYAPDFLSHLIVFALRLRNSGISDKGLIVHLSEYLAGNVYGFGTQGHQTVYEELNTYTLAVAWAMGSRPLWNSDTFKMQVRGSSVPSLASSFFHMLSKASTQFTTSERDKLQNPHTAKERLRPRVRDPPPPFATSHYSPHSSVDPMKPMESRILSGFSQFHAPHRLNPYYVPWIMAQLVTDPRIENNVNLRKQLDDVMGLFHTWEPSARPLRDLQYRLEPLKAKL
ncbi:hypothetical protein HDU76_006331 [Blyttiomyces sp. JEL0837]|nr:hypothetical protein HDU76_006331 [Blyttiomyces sp. JEL0837]